MALRITGSVIGEPITSSSSSATGMWLSQEVAALQQDGIWQIAPGFTLTSSAATVNEGASITITLTTTGIPNGTAVPYVISGANIFANDSANGVITGNFVIQNNSNTISFAANADLLTEGSEAFTITAGGASTSVTINDTSNAIVNADAQFPYTTLALHGNGTNNTQNNTFLDSSTNNFSITRNGNSTQGTFSPYGGNWSNYFDGTGDYLSVPTNTAFAFGTGDFTVECFFNLSIPQSTRSMHLTDSTVTNGLFLKLNSGNISIGRTGTAEDSVFSYSFSINTWYHVAFSRSGTTVYCFVNGSLVGSTTNSINYAQGGYTIGSAGGAAQPFEGYISNLRMLKGTALYTSAFTPSTSPLTAIANTSLLTCQDNRFIDESPNNFTITKTGDVSVQRFNPFSPVITTPTTYSAYFDGTGDYLSVPDNVAFTMGSGDFTIECWVYLQNVAQQIFIGTCNAAGSQGSMSFVLGLNGSSYPQVGVGYAGAMYVSTFGTVLTTNRWYHIAGVRNGAMVNVYVDGVKGPDLNMASLAITDSTETVAIGRNGAGNFEYVTGYISNVRIVKGTAVYTGAFTPPTAPLTAIANTSLLTCQSPTFIDNSTNTFAITAVGNSQPTTVNPFGVTNTSSEYSTTTFGGSAYFDGTGDSLTISSSSAFAYGTGAFTVEFWVYSIGTAAAQVWVLNSGLTLNIQRSPGGFYNVYDGTDRISSTAVIPHTWNHVAVVRSGTGTNQTNLYVNGVSVLNWTNTVNYAADNFAISGSGSFPCTCYISNLRVVKGTAIYTANFTPPIAPVTAVANTTMLLNFTNAGIIDNAMIADIETNADAKISSTQSKFGGTSIAFDGSSDFLKIPGPNGILNVGTGDFTVECWVYLNTVPSGYSPIITNEANNGFYINFRGNGTIALTDTSTVYAQAPSALTTGSWFHVAVVRNAGSSKVYVNGTGGTAVSCTVNWTINTTVYVGGGPSYAPIDGYIDDLRVTKGYARYTSNFTPPTEFANK